MANNASRDQNSVPTLLGALSTDGVTTVPIQTIVATHGLSVSDGISGIDHGPVNAPRDQNNIPVLMGVSSQDGVTPVVVYATSDGRLLIDSN